MSSGVRSTYGSPKDDSLAVSRRPLMGAARKTSRMGLPLLCSLSTLIFASSALASTKVDLGKAGSFSVLGGETITNTGNTTMSGDLGLSPGSSVTGNPTVLGETHIRDQVAGEAKSALSTAFTTAANEASNGPSGGDIAGSEFLAGTYTASTSLLLSASSVTLNAQGNPNAVFIFQIGSTLTTGSNTSVSLVNGAQACNVFWQVGSSATLGTGTHFVGTIMAADSITANTGATILGRLLAQTASVTLEENTITTSACAAETGGGGGTKTGGGEGTKGSEGVTGGGGTPTGGGTTAVPGATTGVGPITVPGVPGTPIATKTPVVFPPIGSRTVGKPKQHHKHPRHPAKRSSKRRTPARPALPHRRGSFTG